MPLTPLSASRFFCRRELVNVCLHCGSIARVRAGPSESGSRYKTRCSRRLRPSRQGSRKPSIYFCAPSRNRPRPLETIASDFMAILVLLILGQACFSVAVSAAGDIFVGALKAIGSFGLCRDTGRRSLQFRRKFYLSRVRIVLFHVAHHDFSAIKDVLRLPPGIQWPPGYESGLVPRS